jgi:hypothetical protein
MRSTGQQERRRQRASRSTALARRKVVSLERRAVPKRGGSLARRLLVNAFVFLCLVALLSVAGAQTNSGRLAFYYSCVESDSGTCPGAIDADGTRAPRSPRAPDVSAGDGIRQQVVRYLRVIAGRDRIYRCRRRLAFIFTIPAAGGAGVFVGPNGRNPSSAADGSHIAFAAPATNSESGIYRSFRTSNAKTPSRTTCFKDI